MSDIEREELENMLTILLELKSRIDDIEMRISYIEQMINDVSSNIQLENALLSIINIRKKVKLEDLYVAFPDIDQAYIRSMLTRLVRKNKIKREGRGIYSMVIK